MSLENSSPDNKCRMRDLRWRPEAGTFFQKGNEIYDFTQTMLFFSTNQRCDTSSIFSYLYPSLWQIKQPFKYDCTAYHEAAYIKRESYALCSTYITSRYELQGLFFEISFPKSGQNTH